MKILVTGGAGYIGSFMVKRLISRGDDVHVLDSLERGYKDAIDSKAIFHQLNLMDRDEVGSLFSSNLFDAVIHFAGYISMEESAADPGLYFYNNSFGSLEIIEQCKRNKVSNFIFSSTAGVYGDPIKIPIPEDHATNPVNPYGESKLMVEKILSWFNKINGLSYTCLRYFNACGAAIDGSMGEAHNPETHIIPKAIEAALNNNEFKMFGDDYETQDGTCIRDYIHVLDLVEAHILALDKITKTPGGYFYNVGTGQGYSNKEIIAMVEKVTGKNIKVVVGARRAGDAAKLIAGVEKIKRELGFDPKFSDLETIIKSAWEYYINHEQAVS